MLSTSSSRRLMVSVAAMCMLIGSIVLGRWLLTRSDGADGQSGTLPNSDILYAPPLEGFQRVLAPRAFAFPADNGPHPDYQTEWWYYTGNLTGPYGRRFGYQLTFFRHALSAKPITRTSEWATNETFLAHFTITDVENKQFYAFDQISRGAAGLAGASGTPQHIFVEGWSVQGDQPSKLVASRDGIGLELELRAIKPPTLQGDGGISPRSSKPGDASYYYSLTRMETTGIIRLGDTSFSVKGASWFDHEWSTGLLDRGQIGWDWFGLHLDDGQDVKWGQIRQPDGSLVVGNGTITGPPNLGRGGGIGALTDLQQSDMRLTVLETWQSPHSGITYPAGWRMEIPKAGIDVEIRPVMLDQELQFPLITYWEGAVDITGTHTGRGYVELTGYGTERK